METKQKSPIPHCPWCEARLKITRLNCPACRIDFDGQVPQVSLPDWDRDEWEFISTFLLSEGNIQLTGKTMGISYPTVKQRLAAAIKKIDGKQRPVRKSAGVGEILEALAAGEITEKDAEAQIRKLKKGKSK